jgi:anthranilate synthase component 2
MKILLLDNYDSFTFNLVHYLELNGNVFVTVVRNDQVDAEQINAFDKIVLSPGPGLPSEAGSMMQVIRQFKETKPMLGVCLGMQALAEACGASLLNLNKVMHGVSSRVKVLDKTEPLFNGLPSEFDAGRYHSWVVKPDSLPQSFKVTAVDEEHNIMAIRHSNHNLCGVQFHPESVMTDFGKQIIRNWMQNT